MRLTTMFAALLVLVTGIPLSPSAQSTATPDPLIGAWEGEGTLFGRPAVFQMSWEWVLGGKFLQLTFTNGFLTDDGTQPLLESMALYTPLEDGRFEGTWFDTRGVVQPLTAKLDENALVVHWGTPETEEGRTTYRIHEEGITVEDSVKQDGAWKAFGAAEYHRIQGP